MKSWGNVKFVNNICGKRCEEDFKQNTTRILKVVSEE
jgi:predicted secreted protein